MKMVYQNEVKYVLPNDISKLGVVLLCFLLSFHGETQ